MVKVKIVNKDKTDSTYNVTYPKAYVQKVIDEENLRGDDRKVKEIYVNGNMVAKLLVSCGKLDLVHYSDSDYRSGVKPKAETPIEKEDLITVEIPGTSYWVSTSTAGNTLISYLAANDVDDDLPF
jgi:hypothetical protein